MDLTQKQIDKFWARVDKSGGDDACWNWTGCCDKGYGKVGYNYKYWQTHNLALRLTAGPPPNPLVKNALHSCKQNRKCCNPKHLRWGTHKENYDDAVKDGTATHTPGELHGAAKLTELKVKEIREKYATGKYLQTQLAEEYGVVRQAIGDIITRRNWKHI
tara:strand:- start:1113 stop:1592 length:480 start_codon:yes stop_codon:yes gene_type:complete